MSIATSHSPAICPSSPMFPPSATADGADADCGDSEPSAEVSDVAASNVPGPDRLPTIEKLADLSARCEGVEAEWWQALVVRFALEHFDAPASMIERAQEHGPERCWQTAMAMLDSRVVLLSGIKLTDNVTFKYESLAAAEASVLDELELFHRRRCADFSDENPDRTDSRMSTKAPPKPKSAPRKTEASKATETDDELISRALSYHGWQKWQANGISNEELFSQICARLSQALVGGPRIYAVDHRIGAIWFDQAHTAGVPSIADDELVAATRRLFNLPQPQELVEHFDNGKVRHTREPKPPAAGNAASPAPPLIDETPAGIEILDTRDIPLADVIRSPYQTRDEPDGEWLNEMVASIKAEGQLTPALVREVRGKWELIAGHTRTAALRKAGRSVLRATVCRCDDMTAARIVFLENDKRRELNPIERARGLQMMVDTCKAAGRTQAQAAADAKISESFLSNALRMLRLPPEWQDRLIAGELSIEQSRALATWVDYPQVINAFSKHIENCGVGKGPIDSHHFDSALGKGIDGGSRPMGKDVFGGGCLFKPTKDEEKDLDIREVKSRWGGSPAKRAFNVPLWNKLQKAAKQKKKDREEKTAAKAGKTTSSSNSKRPRYEGQFDQDIKEAWLLAYRSALAERLTGKKKLSASDRTIVARLALFHADPLSDELAPEDVIYLQPAALDERLLTIVQNDVTSELGGAWDTGSFEFEPLHAVAEALGLDPVTHFKVTRNTFGGFGDDDLAMLASQMDLEPKGNRDAIIATIADATWPRDEVPALLHLPAPKKPKAKK